MNRSFSRLLLDWYKINARVLPWRGHSDPYAVWVSEIMLQQTRVETVIPYFLRWMERFPDIPSLAAASEEDVLRVWEGLGYYSRARSLHKAAGIIMGEYSGTLPSDYNQLRKLPGIGAYTAAAISSIAFKQDRAVVDGNVKRVLARVHNYTTPVNTPGAEKELEVLAQELLPPGQAGDYNQALMDLGATLCVPRNPVCERCPVHPLCYAYAHSAQALLPVMAAKPLIPHYIVVAAVLRQGEKVLIAKRPSSGLLGGLWEFPGGKVEIGETHVSALQRELMEELNVSTEVGEKLGVYRHAYTHFRVTVHAYFAKLVAGDLQAMEANEIRWAEADTLHNFPMGKIDRMISLELLKEVEKRAG